MRSFFPQALTVVGFLFASFFIVDLIRSGDEFNLSAQLVCSVLQQEVVLSHLTVY